MRARRREGQARRHQCPPREAHGQHAKCHHSRPIDAKRCFLGDDKACVAASRRCVHRTVSNPSAGWHIAATLWPTCTRSPSFLYEGKRTVTGIAGSACFAARRSPPRPRRADCSTKSLICTPTGARLDNGTIVVKSRYHNESHKELTADCMLVVGVGETCACSCLH